MIKEIKIPEISENVEKGLIASVLVSEGDKVTVEQSLVEVETDKATTEIPSDYEGIVKEIKVKEGDEVSVNQVIMLLEVRGEGEESEGDISAEDKRGGDESTRDKSDKASAKKKPDEPSSEDKASAKKATSAETRSTSKPAVKEPDHKEDVPFKEERVPVSPLARKIARENNVRLSDITPSGPGNRISRADVEQYIEREQGHEVKAEAGREEKSAIPKETPAGETSEPLNNIGRITAQTMQEAWQNIPHVTQFDEADITDLENFRKQHLEAVEKQGGKLTVTAILIKITAFALQKFPKFNASLDMDNQKIIYKNNYHIGVAVDTERGLLVPVVRDVNRKSLTEISVQLADIAERARDKKLSPDEMHGGTFTISNLGGIGGTGFTPIVYPPQVAILGVSRSKFQPVYTGEELRKRLVMPLSLSYDHRVINGADGARFLRWICAVLEDPYALFL